MSEEVWLRAGMAFKMHTQQEHPEKHQTNQTPRPQGDPASSHLCFLVLKGECVCVDVSAARYSAFFFN